MAPENDKLPTVPKQYAGRWIAWNRDQTSIVASGGTMEDARRGAKSAGEQRPILAKVPQANVRFLGGVR
jgi:hypothetical protein